MVEFATAPALRLALVSAVVVVGVTFAVSWLLIASRRWHMRWTGDALWHLPQKIHDQPVPRVGGVAILAGFLAGLAHWMWFSAAPLAWQPAPGHIAYLLGGLAPVALVGLAEDLTKKVSPGIRLVAMVLGSFVVFYGRDVWLPRLDIGLLDPLMRYWGVALVFSMFACVGATNAYNIVDGLNGLLGGLALITLTVVAWVAFDLRDYPLFMTTALLAVAVLAWLPFNWPHARVFAGDGGAYSLGFLSAALIIILLHRHPRVSPWFGLTAAALPIWETLFSIWRRHRTGVSALEPDQSHLHQLVRTRLHWRMVRRANGYGAAASTHDLSGGDGAPPIVSAPNGACSPWLWALHAAVALAGAMFYDQPMIAAGIFSLFVLIYVGLHMRLQRSRRKYSMALAY